MGVALTGERGAAEETLLARLGEEGATLGLTDREGLRLRVGMGVSLLNVSSELPYDSAPEPLNSFCSEGYTLFIEILPASMASESQRVGWA